ncbi:MAG: ubiquinol-cytochrome c reductase iron-sulfur subunit [Thermoplasmatota archaeon]
MNVLGAAFGIMVLGGTIAMAVAIVPPHSEDPWDRPTVDGSDRDATRSDLRSTFTRLMHGDIPLVALRLPADALDQATASRSAPDPWNPDLRIVVYDARSTHLGCPVDWYQDAARAWLLDPCSHSRFNPFASGQNYPEQPAPHPLAAYETDWRMVLGEHHLLVLPA